MGLPRFAVVDVETSGLSTRRNRILQIGVVTVEPDGTVVDAWSTLVRLRWPWSRVGPRKVHGITRRTLRGAPKSDAVLHELRDRLAGSVFTAHNAEFDAAFIERAADRDHVPLSLGRRLCTLQLSRRLDPDRQLTHGWPTSAPATTSPSSATTTPWLTPPPPPPSSPTSSPPTACATTPTSTRSTRRCGRRRSARAPAPPPRRRGPATRPAHRTSASGPSRTSSRSSHRALATGNVASTTPPRRSLTASTG